MQFKPTKTAKFKIIWQDPIAFVAAAFAVGLFPYMPGTVTTLATIPIYLVLAQLPMWLYNFVCFALICLGAYCCGYLNAKLGTKDHQVAAFDEVVGFLVTMIGLPLNWYFIVAGFILFRLFDIWKPLYIGWADKHWHGGWGVVMDDVLAGATACVLLHLACYLLCG